MKTTIIFAKSLITDKKARDSNNHGIELSSYRESLYSGSNGNYLFTRAGKQALFQVKHSMEPMS